MNYPEEYKLPHRNIFMLNEEPELQSFSKFQLFDETQVDLVRQIDTTKFAAGTITYDGVERLLRNEIRVVKDGRIPEQEFPWVYDRVREKCRSENNRYFQVEIFGLLDGIRLMRYDACEENPEMNGHFGWHRDTGAGSTSRRKLSMICGMSDPSEFEGGDLIFFLNGEVNMGKLNKGEAILFPSYLSHRVMPVTKGVRHTMVAFISGPRYK